jgi:hypothetical protein
MAIRIHSRLLARTGPVLLAVAVAAATGVGAATPGQAAPKGPAPRTESAVAAAPQWDALAAVERWRARQERPHTSADARAVAVPKEGSFVSYQGRAFRIVGGALMYISTWSVYGGPQPLKKLSKAQYDQFVYWPWDGVFVETAQDGRIYRFVGGAPVYVSTWAAYGNVPQRTVRIDKAVVDHAKVYDFPYGWLNPAPLDWERVNGKLVLDQDLYVLAAQTGRVYKIVGGSPQYMQTWAFPHRPTDRVVRVDANAIERAGQAGHWSHLRKYPYDGWPVRNPGTGSVYITAGGAPVYVSKSALAQHVYDNYVPAPYDERWASRGGEFPFDHLRYVPADGTFLNAFTSGMVYRVQDGVPVRVLSWADHGGVQPYTSVDDEAIARAGDPAPYDHLLAADQP